MCWTCNSEAPTSGLHLGPVVQTPVSTNQGLNFNLGFFFFLSKALSRIVFFTLFRVQSSNCRQRELNLICFFKLSYLSSNFALTLGYVNPASNNPALTASWICSRQSQVQILGHASKINSHPVHLLPVGIFNIVMFHLNYLLHYP